MKVNAITDLSEVVKTKNDIGAPSTYRKRIKKHMKAKNWKMIGAGAFSLVFANPKNNKVIKIVAPDIDNIPGNWWGKPSKEEYKEKIESENELIGFWMKFIDKNKDSPYLPKFYKTKVEKIENMQITLYTMEKLQTFKDDIFGDVVESLMNYVNQIINYGDYEDLNDAYANTIQDLINEKGEEMEFYRVEKKQPSEPEARRYFPINMSMKTAAKILKKDFGPFVKMIMKVVKQGQRWGLNPDFHMGNIMIRPGGEPFGKTLVITDPWFISSGDPFAEFGENASPEKQITSQNKEWQSSFNDIQKSTNSSFNGFQKSMGA